MRKLIVLFAVLSLFAAIASAQFPPQQMVPQPVDIPIQNITQQTPVWCWAAVAQQIIAAIVGPNQTPAQCALVENAYGAPPGSCCSGADPRCVTVGSLPQIQTLILRFGGQVSSIAPPTDPMTLYNTLANRHPIILEVQTGPMSTHVVVLRGMSFQQSPYGVQPVLEINDPMSYTTQTVPFASLVGVWRDAIVVY
ncbi:MAG TPA: papain-like cysteine protease family protein [Thermoanaerobaculia bacterium]|nr:papain-like cysteine protease family protein [Thermoanaerobaculia bacterium]